MPRQLAFDLPVREALGRDDFFVAPSNTLALRMIENWRDWPASKLALVGPAGAGKTHLAHVWAAEAGATIVAATDLSVADIAALSAHGRVAVEDVPAATGKAPVETALLHLHNHLLAAGGRLLLTGRAAPARWPVALPDLASRLQATVTATLEPPDDALLAAVLVKLFADRQLAVPPALIPYLVRRMERSLAAARRLVDRLDASALAEGRAISRALAAEVLDRGDPGTA
jgi:chromosomal replication initiation ATPase DnaA